MRSSLLYKFSTGTFMGQEELVFEDMKEVFTSVFGKSKDLWKFSFHAIDNVFTVHGQELRYVSYVQIQLTTEAPPKYIRDVLEYDAYLSQDGPYYYVPKYPTFDKMSLVLIFYPKKCVVQLKHTEKNIIENVLTVSIEDEWDPNYMLMIKRYLEKVVHSDLYSPALPL